MDTQKFYQIISKFLDAATVNGVLPYHKLTALVKQYGNNLQELPLSVLNDRKFEVKPGVIVHFQNNSKNPEMLKDIRFDDATGVKFAYQSIHYGNMDFISGTNQVIFKEHGIEVVDAHNNHIELTITGTESFCTEHNDL